MGIKHAKGDFVMFLDADDYFPKGKIDTQLNYFLKQPEIDMVLGKSKYIFEEGANKDMFRFPDDSHHVHNVLLGSAMIRKKVFQMIGVFDEDLRFGEDFDWFNRVRESNILMLATDDTALYYRRHDNNMTKELDLEKSQMYKLLKNSLDRRRQAGKVLNMQKLSDYKS